MTEPVGWFYLFGSWSRTKEPRDVDLLFVYDPRHCTAELALKIRKTFEQEGRSRILRPLQMVLLGLDEERQCEFIPSEQARFIFDAGKAPIDETIGKLVEYVEEILGIRFGRETP